jgi:beta-glucosidase
MKTLWLAAVLACAAPWAEAAIAAPVRVEGGLLRGVTEGDLAVYRGVPFAAPPIGDLRWRAPQAAAEWSGVLEADQFAPGCVPSMGDPSPSGASEDCLYLNVWTPARSPGERLPVLVWIHGGGFNGGATSIPVHDGAKLARHGVVLVTIAYRVGILGFHAQPELSAESPQHVSGNYGLLDMIAALQWIQRNIPVLGGDPRHVTIFGESAGGIAVSMLCASPLANGLFHGAISQSGGSFGPSSRSPVPGENMRLLADAEASGAGLAEAAGVQSLEELRALTPEEVVEAGRSLPGMAWPIIDGWVIPGDQYELYESGRFNDTPILVGYNSDEGLSFTRARTPQEYVAGVRKRYGPFADRLLEAYPTAPDAISRTARDLARDSAFGWHTWVWARLQSVHGHGKAFYYYFDQHPEHPEGSPEADHGAPHGVDVPYVFENLDVRDEPVAAEDRRISAAMAAYWTNFAKRGDPNGEGMPAWPPFSDANPVVMYFAGTHHVGSVPSEDSLRVLDDYFAWRRSPAPYLDPALPPERRAADLVSRMTLGEKVLQMQSTAPAIPSLGVPAYNWWNEALHGVAQGRATAFPQAIGLAATWDADLMRRVADIISTEARAKYNEALTRPAPSGPETLMTLPGRTAGLTYWSPNINIFRDPRWGRGQETYGEDPYLTGRMAVAFVTGMQGNDLRYLKVVATPKHYAVHSGPEPERHSLDARVSEQDMVDTYLPAFRTAVVEGKAGSVMCVYNAVNGTPGCASSDLLQRRLREQWGFRGYVVSDCGAVNDIHRNHKYASTLGEAAVAAVRAGTDLTCGTEYRTLVDEVQAGRIREAEIDRAVERLFEARFRLGMFDPPDRVPYSKISIADNDSSAHREVAREAARKAIVLLKNEDGLLPLDSSVRKIAVVGPSADDPVAVLGNYHGISSRQVTALEGIEQQFSTAQVRYAQGATYTASTHALIPGIFLTPGAGGASGVMAEYCDNPDLQGEPKLSRPEPRAYFDMGMEDPAVVAAVGQENYSIRWTATLTAPATGEYDLTVYAGMWNRTATARLYLDGQEVRFGTAQTAPGPRHPPHARVQLEGGRQYVLRVEYRQPGAGGTLQLGWIPPAEAALAEARTLIEDSDVAIVFVGLSSELEGEEMRAVEIPGFRGGDRTSLDLPEPQEELVRAALGTGTPVIVVLTSGSAISANHAAEHAPALLAAWYGGEEAGTAIAETLAGVSNPAGRLPVTFYTGVDQLPPFTDYAMKNRTYRYFQGEPLFPFGFGLSYSTFEYSGLNAKRTPDGAQIRVTVKNTSARDGDEVVQLYIAGGSGEGAPTRSLRGFQRIHLRAGESREVSFALDAEDVPEPGAEISVGGGQPLGDTPHVKGSL